MGTDEGTLGVYPYVGILAGTESKWDVVRQDTNGMRVPICVCK
jgi:hypothetical protein